MVDLPCFEASSLFDKLYDPIVRPVVQEFSRLATPCRRHSGMVFGCSRTIPCSTLLRELCPGEIVHGRVEKVNYSPLLVHGVQVVQDGVRVIVNVTPDRIIARE